MPRLLIVDDHPLYRLGLLAALSAALPDTDVEGAPSAEAALALLEREPGFDLVLVDQRLPGMDGLSALVHFGERRPDVPRVLISGSEEAGLARRAVEAGASGFIPKSLSVDEVAAAIRRVLEGEVFLPQEELPEAQAPGTLTLRQLEVLRLLGEGYTNKEIAKALEITVRTARAHVEAIFEHLGAENRTQAVLAAQRAGLLQPGNAA
jgi:DNA-binding NarL/FixJ family response regulator